MTAPDKIWIAPDFAAEIDAQPRYGSFATYHHQRTVDELLEVIEWQREWIDAVPNDMPLPAMPGYDRDHVDTLIAKHRKGG